MKAEERHELHENVLAKWLGELVQNSQAYLGVAAGLLLLAGLVWAGMSTLRSRDEVRRTMGWSDIFLAQETADLEKIAKTYSGTQAGAWALQRSADMHLQRGSIELFRDFKKATEQFEEARDGYKAVLESPQDDLLAQRAYFGLAQCYESLRDFTEAKKNYATIIEKWPNSVTAKLAADRQLLLDRPSTSEFYEWYFAQTPPMSEAAQAAARAAQGLPQQGATTPLDTSLPTQPDIQLPSAVNPTGSDPSAAPPSGSDAPK